MAREALQEYLSAVGSHIRWRRARVSLLRELSDHISDQAEEYRAQGEGEDAALEQAVAEMGDPEEVGRELDRLHRPQNRWGMALVVLALAVAGLALQQAVYRALGYDFQDDSLRRQAAGILVGGGVLLAVWFSDVPALLRRRGWAVGAIAATWLSVLLLSPLMEAYFPGASRWSLPVYLVLLLPVPYAALLCRLKGRGYGAVFLCGLGALFLPFLALRAPSFSAYTIVFFSMLLALAAAVWRGWFSGRRWKNLLLALGPGCLLFALYLSSPYLRGRWSILFHPERDPLGAGYFYLFLREQHVPSPASEPLQGSTDLLLYNAAQLYGQWVYAAVGAGCLLLTLLLLRRIHKLQCRSGTLLALSALWPLVLQAASYLLYNMGWFPGDPLSFPFLSYGVCFLVVDGALAGVLLSVFRMDALTRDVAAASLGGGPLLPRLPGRILFPLGKGTLSIEYRRRAE